MKHQLTCLRCKRVLPRWAFDTCTMASGRERPYERCQECRSESGWTSREGGREVTPPNPSGLCMCGCGQTAPLATRTNRAFGHIKGQSTKYVVGHGPHVTSGPRWEINELTGCWIWLRAKVKDRGQVGIWDKTTKRQRHGVAARLVYEEHKGPIPAGLELDHLCMNPICVNPDHLEPVTHEENMRRLWVHRRQKAS